MQRIEAGALVLGDSDLLLIARLVWLGLAAMERRDGGAPDGFRAVAAELCQAAEQCRTRIEREARRSKAVPGTRRAPDGAAQALSGRWLSTLETANMLGCGETYARRLAREGRLRARRDHRGAWIFEPMGVAGAAARRASRTRLETAA